MKEEIKSNLNNPRVLEELYRKNNVLFKEEFNSIFSEIQQFEAAQIWSERLNFEGESFSWKITDKVIFVVVAGLIAGFIAKIPSFFSVDAEFFFPRNLGFVVFPFLTAYFAWFQQFNLKKSLILVGIYLFSAIYINLIPGDDSSSTLILACIHLVVLFWLVTGFAYAGNLKGDMTNRMSFLRFNGDLIVMATVILASGGLMSAITIGLFAALGLQIEEIYFKTVGIWGAASVPIVATYLVETFPQLVSKVSPVIAKVFTPFVLVMLLIYLVVIIITGKDPYNDREFLLLFNILLIGVMALILFSIAGSSLGSIKKFEITILFALSVVAILINSIALSAILFRIFDMGITPNRLAVFGSNILILVHVLMVAYNLFNSINQTSHLKNVEKSIAIYLPVYAVWAAIVIFLFPVLFGFS